MEDYNKIIDSLGVKYLKSRNIKILSPVNITNHYDVENYIVLLHDGKLAFGENGMYQVEKGDMLFIPGGRSVSLWYGQGAAMNSMTNESFINRREDFFEANKDVNAIGKLTDSFSYITFESKVYDCINFFASLDIPPFIIKDNLSLARIIKEVVVEEVQNLPGKQRLINIKTEQIIVDVIRYILEEGLFVEQLATNSTYFKDPRLIDIFTHIKRDLGGDLSNKALAEVANVSEDYVGQYFKMLTGINPQDYIEYQRMEQAVNMLRTSTKSIREIGNSVGYKDTAYFCRRFKMMFGIPAGKMRRRDLVLQD